MGLNSLSQRLSHAVRFLFKVKLLQRTGLQPGRIKRDSANKKNVC